MNSIKTYIQLKQQEINKALESYLNSLSKSPLLDVMQYAVLNGGKRLRPILILATGESLNAQISCLTAPACAVEFLHCFSLIHDDLPAMDNDDLRRGKPTCHKAFSEALAILAGDALHTLGFQILAEDKFLTAEQKNKMILCLAQYGGAEGIALGQTLDMENKVNLTLEELDYIHYLKTGKLFCASFHLGYLASNINDISILNTLLKFAKMIGLAFQIQDDILDETSNTTILGKTVGSDSKNNKPTYPQLIGVDASKKRALDLLNEAIALLKQFPVKSEHLIKLAHFIVFRNQ